MFTWIFALVLILVLFIHEFGHFLAMAFLGYKKKGILFAPPFGAVAYGAKKDETDKEKVTVLMAGPLPGIIIGLALFFLGGAFLQNDLNKAVGFTFIFINSINLLPISPLECGRIIDSVFLHKSKIAQLVLAGLGQIFLVIYAIISQSILIIIMTFFFAVALWARIKDFQGNKDKEVYKESNLTLLARIVAGMLYVSLVSIAVVFFLIY